MCPEDAERLSARPTTGIDPRELLDMINAKKMPTKAVIRGLAKELDIDERYLEKLAGELR